MRQKTWHKVLGVKTLDCMKMTQNSVNNIDAKIGPDLKERCPNDPVTGAKAVKNNLSLAKSLTYKIGPSRDIFGAGGDQAKTRGRSSRCVAKQYI
jgi:hypothetical protein